MISNNDTESNRKELTEYIRNAGYDTVVNYGYNIVDHVVRADYDKLILESNGTFFKIKMRIDDYIPMAQEFVIAFIPSTKEQNFMISECIGRFFDKQTSIGDSSRDETWVVHNIEKANKEYRSIPIDTKECFVNISKIAKKGGKSTIEGYIEEKESWLDIEQIAAFTYTQERQIAIMPFESYMNFLSVNDIEKFDKITADRKKKQDERMGRI